MEKAGLAIHLKVGLPQIKKMFRNQVGILVEITTESDYLKENKDFMDELNSFRNIFKQQQQGLNLMSNDYQAGQNFRPKKDQEKLEQLQSLQKALRTRVEHIKELEIEAKRAYEAVGRYSVWHSVVSC